MFSLSVFRCRSAYDTGRDHEEFTLRSRYFRKLFCPKILAVLQKSRLSKIFPARPDQKIVLPSARSTTRKDNFMDRNDLELELQDRKLNAPRLTPEGIESAVTKEQYHAFEGSCLTVCCLTLVNGFTVTGESACASPENFNEEIGRRVSRAKAIEKIWPLEGYRLKEMLYQDQLSERD